MLVRSLIEVAKLRNSLDGKVLLHTCNLVSLTLLSGLRLPIGAKGILSRVIGSKRVIGTIIILWNAISMAFFKHVSVVLGG